MSQSLSISLPKPRIIHASELKQEKLSSKKLWRVVSEGVTLFSRVQNDREERTGGQRPLFSLQPGDWFWSIESQKPMLLCKIGAVPEAQLEEYDLGVCLKFVESHGELESFIEALRPWTNRLWKLSGEAVEPVQKLDSISAFLEHKNRLNAKCVEALVSLHVSDFEQLKARGKQRFQNSKLSLSKSLQSLVEIVTVPEQVLPTSEYEAPIMRCCEIIGRKLRVSFELPSTKLSTEIFDETSHARDLNSICFASKLRSRKVSLKEEHWWKQDMGPLLVFRKDDQMPMALVPTKKDGYQLIDPNTSESILVTRQVAGDLAAEAYTFYRPFPEKISKISDLLSFFVQDLRGDLKHIIWIGVLGAFLQALVPIITANIFSAVIPNADRVLLQQLMWILLIAAIARWAFGVTQSIAMQRIQGRVNYAAQAALWDRLLTLPVDFFRKYNAGDLANRGLGMNQVQETLNATVLQSLLGGVFCIFSLILMFFYSATLALYACALLLVFVIISGVVGVICFYYQKQVVEQEGVISGKTLQVISGVSKLRFTGTENKGLSIWAEAFARKKQLFKKASIVQNILLTVLSVIPLLGLMIMLCVYQLGVFSGTSELEYSSFLGFLAAYTIVQTALTGMFRDMVLSVSIFPLLKRIWPILKADPEVVADKPSPGKLSGTIEASHVSFRYAEDRPLVLEDVSIRAEQGEYVAIVGDSGSGKSTLMRLLMGFDKPISGGVYCDDKNLNSVDIREVRQQFGVVLQNSSLMAGSIFENITGGDVGLSLDDAWEAAQKAGCADDIRDMPMQMHTVVPPGGGTLSGGQRQRIMIARALVRKPKIIFFDEATSALDNKNQEMVQQSLSDLKVTRVVIAHRLSTIRHADRIYVMRKGTVVEEGDYESLMQLKGAFYEQAHRQIA